MLLSIFIIGLGAIVNPIGPMNAPVGDYNTIPFFKGFVEGYQAMDPLAAGMFALIVIENIQGMACRKKATL